MGNKDVIVKKKLDELVQGCEDIYDISCADGVVVSYVVGVVETLDDDEECFDLEEFVEVMSAYIPGFELIQSETVSAWLGELRDGIQEADASIENALLQPTEKHCMTNKNGDTQLAISSLKSVPRSGLQQHHVDELKDCCGSQAVQNFAKDHSMDVNVQKIKNIFPNRSAMEIMKSLSIVNGDVNG